MTDPAPWDHKSNTQSYSGSYLFLMFERYILNVNIQSISHQDFFMIFYWGYFRKYVNRKYVIYIFRKVLLHCFCRLYCVKIHAEMVEKSQVKLQSCMWQTEADFSV